MRTALIAIAAAGLATAANAELICEDFAEDTGAPALDSALNYDFGTDTDFIGPAPAHPGAVFLLAPSIPSPMSENIRRTIATIPPQR